MNLTDSVTLSLETRTIPVRFVHVNGQETDCPLFALAKVVKHAEQCLSRGRLLYLDDPNDGDNIQAVNLLVSLGVIGKMPGFERYQIMDHNRLWLLRDQLKLLHQQPDGVSYSV